MKHSISVRPTVAEFHDLLLTEISALRNFARKFTPDIEDINDLVQETLIKALRFSEKFKEGTSLKAWLFVIMRNTYINEYRKTKSAGNKIELVEDVSTAKVLPQFAAQNAGESSFTGQDIEIALKRLSPELYIPFKMYTNGYKYNEIAEQTGVPIGTVKTRMHNGRIKLKKILKEYQYYA